MQISGIAFGTTDWSGIERIEHKGETGVAYSRTRQFAEMRLPPAIAAGSMVRARVTGHDGQRLSGEVLA